MSVSTAIAEEKPKKRFRISMIDRETGIIETICELGEAPDPNLVFDLALASHYANAQEGLNVDDIIESLADE